MRKENKDNAVLTTPDRKMVVLLSCETGGGGVTNQWCQHWPLQADSASAN